MPELRVELVPRTCWFSNLRSELSRADWEKCKAWASKASGSRCAICRQRGARWPVECHERWSYIEEGGRRIQRLDGLIALCPACHEAKHIGYAEINGRLDKAAEHIRKVNGWTDEQTFTHIAHAFGTWRERSRVDWELDVSWLERTLGISVPERARG